VARNTIDEIASSLDDIAITLEEMKDDCLARSDTIEQIRRSIEKATDAIDEIENREVEKRERA
jgi:methyl-accepting chemotaxis protein